MLAPRKCPTCKWRLWKKRRHRPDLKPHIEFYVQHLQLPRIGSAVSTFPLSPRVRWNSEWPGVWVTKVVKLRYCRIDHWLRSPNEYDHSTCNKLAIRAWTTMKRNYQFTVWFRYCMWQKVGWPLPPVEFQFACWIRQLKLWRRADLWKRFRH